METSFSRNNDASRWEIDGLMVGEEETEEEEMVVVVVVTCVSVVDSIDGPHETWGCVIY